MTRGGAYTAKAKAARAKAAGDGAWRESSNPHPWLAQGAASAPHQRISVAFGGCAKKHSPLAP